MKFFSLALTLAAGALGVTAQNIFIGAPAPGSTIKAGANFTVEVDKPNSLSSSTDVAIVIALRACGNTTPSCDTVPVQEDLGTVLYHGPYHPQYTNVTGQGFKPPLQNFTVTAPATYQPGPAVLSVTHFVLIGAAPSAVVDVQNVTLNLVA